MIEFINVSKAYPLKRGKRIIIDDISFKFPEKKNIGILGRNGSGKSTLLRLIGGGELPDNGHIRRTGKFSWPLGFSGGFDGYLSGEENLRFISRIYGADLYDVIDYVYDFSELGSAMQEPVKNYSNGMKAKLAFGLSLAINFDVYLIDEVLSVGDPGFQKKSKAAFEERRKTANLILVSHDMNMLREYTDIVILMHNQQMTVYDDIEQAIDLYTQISEGTA